MKQRREGRSGRDVPAVNLFWRLRIELHGSSPLVWREAEVPPDLRLDDLHRCLQRVMGWDNSHLHVFAACERTFGPVPEPLDGSLDEGGEEEDERAFLLEDLLHGCGDSLQYFYDFGDSWRLDVRLEELGLPGQGSRAPRITAAKRASPPEDSGGVVWFNRKVRCLGRKRGRAWEEAIEVLGEAFRPAEYDLEAVNRELANLEWPWRERVLAATAPQRSDGLPKVGRNDPCPCGSGKKYKKCCLGAAVKQDSGAGSSKVVALHGQEPRCGLCGKVGKLTRTECCGEWICDDEDQYVLFSYSHVSCRRNHRRYTLCSHHHTEEHAGDWQSCDRCREAFEPEMYAYYGTNEFNFVKLDAPPQFEPKRCTLCGKSISLADDEYSMGAGGCRCSACTWQEVDQRPQPRRHR